MFEFKEVKFKDIIDIPKLHISLGVKSLIEGMTVQRAIVEESLILGATPQDASRNIINNTFDAAPLRIR